MPVKVSGVLTIIPRLTEGSGADHAPRPVHQRQRAAQWGGAAQLESAVVGWDAVGAGHAGGAAHRWGGHCESREGRMTMGSRDRQTPADPKTATTVEYHEALVWDSVQYFPRHSQHRYSLLSSIYCFCSLLSACLCLFVCFSTCMSLCLSAYQSV